MKSTSLVITIIVTIALLQITRGSAHDEDDYRDETNHILQQDDHVNTGDAKKNNNGKGHGQGGAGYSGESGSHSADSDGVSSSEDDSDGVSSSEDEDVCGARWTKVYEHGPNGEHVFGDKVALIQAAHAGADIRVLNGDYLTTVQNVKSTSDGDLCGQALFHISKNGYDKFQNDAYWWFVYLCTTGHWYMARYNVGEHVAIPSNEVKVAMTWFLREKCITTAKYQVSDTGDVIYGAMPAMINAVSRGAGLCITIPSGGYTFPVDNIQYDQGIISGQALWHVSARLAPAGDHDIFQDNAYWWFTLTSTDAEQDISRWSVGEHENRGNTRGNVATSWFVDPCWKRAYSHDANGTALKGSFTALLAAVEAGYKVKIVYDGHSVQADDVWVANGQVYAVVLSSLSRNGLKYFNSDVTWNWQIASTSGVVNTVRYLVGDPVFVPGTNKEYKAITWYVDKGNWSLALSVASNGTVVSGSKAVLEQAVRNGNDVRYRMRFPIIPNFSIIRGPDNLAISANGNIGAMHVRSVGMTFMGSDLEFLSNPFWWFSIVTSEGRLEVSRWTLGIHEDRGKQNRLVDLEFFVSE